MGQSLYEYCALHCPELIEQWDQERNAPMRMDALSYGTTRKAWWRCAKGHQWQALISNRRKGNGCPICAKKCVAAGVNDFATLHPELLDEWDYDANQGISPWGIGQNSRQKVWWICKAGHRWSAPVDSRSRGNGCPVCSNRTVQTGVNDLETLRPELAKQWHPTKNGLLRPSDLTGQSGRKVWWRCPKGHDWLATVAGRAAGNGCPICSNRKILPGVNDLATTDPELAAQWHPTKNKGSGPWKYSRHSGYKAWWICSRGHEWQAAIGSRIEGRGCPVCTNRRILPGVNDLATLEPELAEQWHPVKNGALRPQHISLHSGKMAWWQCLKGHEWQAQIASRAAGVGCPYCAGKRPVPGQTDLGTLHPKLAAQWHREKNEPLRPRDVTSGSGRKVWWCCPEGHEWQATVAGRVHGNGCPYCAGHRAITGQTDLATVAPALAKQWHPTKNHLTPDQITEKSGRQIWWICGKGHEWRTTPLHRAQGNGCPYCSGRQVDAGTNSLQAVRPELAKQWHPTRNGTHTQTEFTPSSGFRAWWRCPEGHEWQAAISTRSLGSGCPFCKSKRVLAGWNDLASVDPVLAAQWHPEKNGSMTPETVAANSNRKVWWLCSRGHETYSSVNNRRRNVVCLKCSVELHTSFAEQAIYLYVSRAFPAYNRFIFKGREIDIYIPSLCVGIEHDGVFHQEQEVQARDQRKETLLQDNGITLIRIKTGSGRSVDRANRVICYNDKKRAAADLEWAIRVLFAFLEEHTGKTLKPDVDIGRDRMDIYRQYILLEKRSSLLHRVPEAAAFWHPEKNGTLQPSQFSPGSGKRVWWRCPEGHEWEGAICSFSGGTRCPYCSGRRVMRGFNDLQTRQPKLAGEWHPTGNLPLTAEDVSEFSNKKVWWRCPKGHEWMNTVNNRSSGKSCPICAGQQVLRGFNDLATLQPDVARLWHPEKNGNLTPEEVTVRSGRMVWWQCEKGHSWQARIADRTAGNRCPYCSGRRAIRGETDMATLKPALAKQWHPEKNGTLMPWDVKPYSHDLVWWRCSQGHEWTAIVAFHTRVGKCPHCGEKAE